MTKQRLVTAVALVRAVALVLAVQEIPHTMTDESKTPTSFAVIPSFI